MMDIPTFVTICLIGWLLGVCILIVLEKMKE